MNKIAATAWRCFVVLSAILFWTEFGSSQSLNGKTSLANSPVSPLQLGSSPFAVSFTDVNNGTVVGEDGMIARTTDGGQSWSVQASGIASALFGVWFTDANTGTAVGGGGIILHTTTGGAAWISQSSGTGQRLDDVWFTDANTGTVVGAGGTILRTTDGGATWNGQSSGTSRHLYGVSFSDANIGTAVGDVGTILRTTDGGLVWVVQESGTMYNLRDVCFTDANAGTTVGAEQTILRTTDGGSTWTEQYTKPATGVYFDAVWFTDIDVGTVVGNLGKILRTTNGGTTWVSQLSGAAGNLYDVSFTDRYTGNAVGAGETILRTTDGGDTWTGQGPLPIQLASLCADITAAKQVRLLWSTISEVNNYGFEIQRKQVTQKDYITLANSLVPGHGTVLEPHGYSFVDENPPLGQLLWYRLKQIDLDGGINYSGAVSIEVVGDMKDESVPTVFALHQNYPNPFNPTTTIRYELPKSSMVRLTVYDILGREVSVLVNERREAGVHEVKFNAFGLSSGVYICRLQVRPLDSAIGCDSKSGVGDFVQTRKLLLLR
jgi:photosystem II stability/assembly factor-like uncharacterized protein